MFNCTQLVISKKFLQQIVPLFAISKWKYRESEYSSLSKIKREQYVLWIVTYNATKRTN